LSVSDDLLVVEAVRCDFLADAGGPFRSTEVFSLNIYKEAFESNNYGLGSAKAVIFFIVVGIITFIQVSATKRLEVER
jgi:raffinose/stachyose/melibiose transport system permease protein